jgi:hypothetical protein
MNFFDIAGLFLMKFPSKPGTQISLLSRARNAHKTLEKDNAYVGTAFSMLIAFT